MLHFFKLNFKKIILLFFLTLMYIFICGFSYSNSISKDLKENILRLHIVANSNSKEDQFLKYLIRDNVIEYINNLSSDISSKEKVVELINNNTSNIESFIQNIIYENGFNYTSSIKLGEFSFPKKFYGDISLPAGLYDAIKIELGNAQGQNWWCVMFPPLCFLDTTSAVLSDDSKELLQSNLTNEEYNLISENSFETNFKFKIVEFFENLNIKLSKI